MRKPPRERFGMEISMHNGKERMRRLLCWRPDTKTVAAGAVLALVLLLIPLYRIAFYSAPWYDDYIMGLFTKNFLVQERSLSSVLQGALYCTKTQWYAWQGTFSSIFLMSLMPAIWGDDKYFLGALFLLTIFLTAILVFVRVLVKDVFEGDKYSCIVLQAVTAAMLFVLIHTPQAGFYWYNAGVHYVGMHSLCLLFIAGLIKLLKTKSRAATVILVIISMLGAFVAGGSNFVTALQGLLVVCTILALAAWSRSKRGLLLLPALVVYGAAFYQNISAPGNNVRRAFYVGQGLDWFSAIMQSFVEAVKHLGRFTGLMTIPVLVLLIPVIWQMVQKSSFQFRYPLLVLLWSVCLYASGFAPSLYSMGNAGLGRTLNVVKITYQLLLILNEIYLLGWLCQYLKRKERTVPSGKCYWWFYPLIGALMLCAFWLEPKKEGSFSSYTAYHYVHTGEANNFYQEYLQRVEILNGDEKDVVLRPYGFRPWILSTGELTENPDNEANRAVASYYGKESVICKQNGD